MYVIFQCQWTKWWTNLRNYKKRKKCFLQNVKYLCHSWTPLSPHQNMFNVPDFLCFFFLGGGGGLYVSVIQYIDHAAAICFLCQLKLNLFKQHIYCFWIKQDNSYKFYPSWINIHVNICRLFTLVANFQLLICVADIKLKNPFEFNQRVD